MNNSTTVQKPKFSAAIQTDGYRKLINSTLQDPQRAQRFIASVSSAVAINPALQECDAGSVLACALLGESLELSPSPQLGQFYMVPFEQKEKKDKNGLIVAPARTVATFMIGWKGYVQLAVRSGQYKKLNVLPIKKGELVKYDPLNEEIEVNLIPDELARETAETIGYYAMFEYVNGFKKSLYWSKEKMIAHADRYSPAFSSGAKNGKTANYNKVSFADYEAGKFPKGTEWLYSSFWYKDFDGMAQKTMIRQLISKWGIMSIQMRQAFELDDSTIDHDGTANYIGGDDIKLLIGESNDAANYDNIDDDDSPDGNVKMDTDGGNSVDTEEISMDDL